MKLTQLIEKTDVRKMWNSLSSNSREWLKFAIILLVGVPIILSLDFESDETIEGTIVISEEELKVTLLPGPIHQITRKVIRKETESGVKAISIVQFRSATPLEVESSTRRVGYVSEFAAPATEAFLIRLARQVGFPETEIENFLRHSYCESTWNTVAYNRAKGGHTGLFQISTQHRVTFKELYGHMSLEEFRQAMEDPLQNAQVAYWLWERDKKNPKFSEIRDGWGDWKASYQCRIRKNRNGVPWSQIITVYRYGETV